MAIDVRFVDSITSTAVTRLSLSDDQPWSLLAAGTDLTPPPLRRAVAGTLLADGVQVPAAAYDSRLIRLALEFSSAAGDTAAEALQNLSRELDRPSNFLLWQPDTTHPVYFRTMRSDFSAVQWDAVERRAAVTILAEPFAIGLEETLTDIVFDGDPASDGLFADVTDIKGDVETPLILDADRQFSSVAARQVLLATRREASPVWTGAVQAEDMTLGTDASTQTIAGFSGGTPNGVRVSFATASLQVRVSDSVDLPRGRYRVYARIKKSVGADPVTLQLGYGNIDNAAVTAPAVTDIVLVDLGDLSVPTGSDPVHDGYSGVELDVGPTTVELSASRTSGTTNLEIDFLAFIPAHDQLSLLSFIGHGGASGPFIRWDGPNESACLMATFIAMSPAASISIVGGAALMVSPGMTNRIYGLRDVTPATATVLTGHTYGATYYPRYLYVRPPST